jgi:hypothetical protein
MEEKGLRGARIRCSGRYLGLRGMELQEAGEKWVMRSCMICIGHQMLFR